MTVEPTKISSLLSRISNHEDNFVERKPDGVNAREIRKTVVAFANSLPTGTEGVLFIGIRNDGAIQGTTNPDSLQKTIREQCERVCYPPITFSTSVLEIDEKTVLAVVVPSSEKKPHFSGPAFVRVGSESTSASPEMFDELIVSRTSKVAAVLEMRGAPITVICLQHKLGSSKHIADTGYRTRQDCMVESCDAHNVRMKDLASDQMVTESLDRIEIGRDEERQRPMLIVRG